MSHIKHDLVKMNSVEARLYQEVLVARVIEKGLPQLEADVQRMRAKANEKTKRFPKLQLAFSNSDNV